MPVMIDLTTADHGGRVSTGKCGTPECGVSCNCGCPYTAMETNGRTELISAIEARYPNEWLGLVIPAEENDDFAPERAMLVVHSADDNEVWDAMNRVTRNQVIHVYFNGAYGDEYAHWAESKPALPGTRTNQPSPFGGEMIALIS